MLNQSVILVNPSLVYRLLLLLKVLVGLSYQSLVCLLETKKINLVRIAPTYPSSFDLIFRLEGWRLQFICITCEEKY